MKIIYKPIEACNKILNPMKKVVVVGRLSHYCVTVPADGGMLVYNLLTKEMVHLSDGEYANLYDNEYLRDHWFVVPEKCNEKEYADLVKWVLQTKKTKSDAITGYTVFTTTDCNARCFYCYEMGRSRISMSVETARKVVAYIKAHCDGKKVTLNWFGGEPLYNADVIDIICDGLRMEGIEFTSKMTSNGYLFSDEIVEKVVGRWNLKRIQISLDGTEKVYNRSKAFIYREGSAYQVVLANIGRLIDAGVRVTIRLNTDLYNADDLIALVDELAERFGGNENLRVYAHLLFKGNESMAEQHTEDEWAVRGEAVKRLNQRITLHGFDIKRGVDKDVRLNHCMADSDGSVTILPTGDIGVCEHFSENEFIGHIDYEGFNQTVIASWKERMPEIPECAECFFYPACTNLKKCPNGGQCFPLQRQEKYDKTCNAMLEEYRRWKEQHASDEE